MSWEDFTVVRDLTMASSSDLTLSGCVPLNWLMVVPQVVTMSLRRAMTT